MKVQSETMSSRERVLRTLRHEEADRRAEADRLQKERELEAEQQMIGEAAARKAAREEAKRREQEERDQAFYEAARRNSGARIGAQNKAASNSTSYEGPGEADEATDWRKERELEKQRKQQEQDELFYKAARRHSALDIGLMNKDKHGQDRIGEHLIDQAFGVKHMSPSLQKRAGGLLRRRATLRRGMGK